MPPPPTAGPGAATEVGVVLTNTTPALRRAWYPVALASELEDRPLGVEVLGERWVVARLGGSVVAFEDACPHRLFPLSEGEVCGEVLRCGYHGWEFEASGRCTRVPSMEPGTPISARAVLRPAAAVEERYGVIWLAPEAPVSGLPTFPEWDDARFECRIDTPLRVAAGVGKIMDNACDTSHFLMVHAGTFGGDPTATSYPRTVERDGWTITATYESPYRVLDDPEHPDAVMDSRHTKRFRLGAVLELRMEFPHDGSTFSILIAVQPVDDGTCRIYRWFARDDIVGDEQRWKECLEVEAEVLDEDARVLSRYRDHTLRLDLSTEVHVPADKLSLAYRRLLRDLVALSDDEAAPSSTRPTMTTTTTTPGEPAA